VRSSFEDEEEDELEVGLKRLHFERGLRAMVLHQLHKRFGVLPDLAVARVLWSPLECIERWGKRVLTEKTLAEVLDEPS